jgi:WD40 repeat protein
MLSQHTLRVPHHRLYLFSWLRQSVPYSLLLWLFFLFAHAASAQTPSSRLVPTSPLLILNTDMHTSSIGRIDTDAEGQYILTVSTDKTAKLWDAQTGELLHTFRIPIAQGNEGMLYAGAISPDGNIVALAGWTGSWDNSACIYIFNAVTGTMLKRLTELPNVINDLEFSPDGKYLAAALATDGLRIYSVSDNWRLVKSLTDYKSQVMPLHGTTLGAWLLYAMMAKCVSTTANLILLPSNLLVSFAALAPLIWQAKDLFLLPSLPMGHF